MASQFSPMPMIGQAGEVKTEAAFPKKRAYCSPGPWEDRKKFGHRIKPVLDILVFQFPKVAFTPWEHLEKKNDCWHSMPLLVKVFGP